MKTLLLTTVALAGVCSVCLAVADCCADASGKMVAKDTVCPTGTCAPQAADKMAAPVKEAVVNTEALAALIRTKVPVTVLDARTGKYDDGRRIPGAQTLSPEAKETEVTALLPDKQALIVTYCVGVKCPASHILGEKLRGLGYVNVLEYHEGIEGWTAAGNAVIQAAK